MPKSKQQKQKERQRRIAREKHDAAVQKLAEEKTTSENKKPLSRTARVMTAAAPPKTDYVADKSRSAFMHRRTGG